MLEKLFRGKRIDNDEWVYGDLIQLNDGRKFIINNKHGACIDDKGNFINTEAPFVCEVFYDSVGQYTGYTDNNKNKIFENDVVSVSIYYDVGCYPHSKKETFVVKMPRIYRTKIDGGFEIIGNTFDNREWWGADNG